MTHFFVTPEYIIIILLFLDYCFSDFAPLTSSQLAAVCVAAGPVYATCQYFTLMWVSAFCHCEGHW